MNNLTPIEPEIVAVVALADALDAARVGPRRRAHAPRVGLSPVSDIYLPIDESPGGYADLADDDDARLFRAVRAGTLVGLYEEAGGSGPCAWVVPADAARTSEEDGGRVGDDPFALEVIVIVRASESGANAQADAEFPLAPGSTLLLRHRLRDLWRRLRVDGSPIAVDGGEWRLGDWAQAWSGDYREVYFTARCLFTHDGSQLPEPES
jgi:hypothetical protein